MNIIYRDSSPQKKKPIPIPVWAFLRKYKKKLEFSRQVCCTQIGTMNQEKYFRAIKIIKRIKTGVDKTTAVSIMDIIRHYLFDERNEEYRKNMLSPYACVVREFNSMVNTHIERMCYHDGWGWGCGLCNGKTSLHMEGKELKKWLKDWCKVKWWYEYDEYETHWSNGEIRMSGMHLILDDDMW